MSSFYDDVMRELVAALGGALFVGNLMALVKASRSPRQAPEGDLAQAPKARTITYMLIGFVVMVWGISSIVTQ